MTHPSAAAPPASLPRSRASLDALFDGMPVFRGLSARERAALVPLFEELSFAREEVILEEGVKDSALYIVATGRVDVRKVVATGESHVLRTLVAGESIGEMKLADEDAHFNSATVVAKDDVVAWRLQIPDLDGVDASLRGRLVANVAKVVTERLRTLSETTASTMQQELEQTRERVDAGRFAISLIAIMSVFNFAVFAVKTLNPASLPPEAFLSPVFILLPCVPIVFLIRQGRRPARDYGLSLSHSARVVRDALLYSLPVLVGLAALKAIWIASDPRLAAEPLFNTRAIFEDGRFDLGFYLLSLLIYVLVCPAQEFFIRSGMQTALDRFLPQPGGRVNWPAILVSNLVFALGHTFIGLGFAIGAFAPGLFWGWLYDRQRSLLGVTVSHMMVGVFALQVLGVQSIIGGH